MPLLSINPSVAQWMSILLMLGRSSLGDIARSHDISYHFYTDDTKLHLSLKRHCLRICQHVNLLLKTALNKLTFGC